MDFGKRKADTGKHDGAVTKGFTGQKLMAQMKQLLAPVHDAEIGDFRMRDHLVAGGVVGRADGWNFLTETGVQWCVALGLARPGELRIEQLRQT